MLFLEFEVFIIVLFPLISFTNTKYALKQFNSELYNQSHSQSPLKGD